MNANLMRFSDGDDDEVVVMNDGFQRRFQDNVGNVSINGNLTLIEIPLLWVWLKQDKLRDKIIPNDEY